MSVGPHTAGSAESSEAPQGCHRHGDRLPPGALDFSARGHLYACGVPLFDVTRPVVIPGGGFYLAVRAMTRLMGFV